MNIGNGIYDLLSNDATIVSLVGTRIYPMRRSQVLPQVPCIIYKTVSTVPSPTKQTRSSVDSVRLEVNIFGSYDECQTIAAAVRAKLDNTIQTQAALIYFQSIIFDDQFDNDEGEYTKGANDTMISINRTVQEYLMRVQQN